MADLTLALRIKADMDRALKETRQLKDNLTGFGASAKVAAGQTAALGAGLAGVTAGASAAGNALKVFGGLAAGLGIAALVKQTLEATVAQEEAVAAVENALANLGAQTTLTVDGLKASAAALQDLSVFGDEAILDMQALLLTFQQIDPSNFQPATEAILDLATALKTDLRSAALQLGKALEDPAQGLTALRRSGTVFTEEQTELIKSLHETGRAAEAQRLILEELERQYGGTAEAARDTLGGALKALGNAFGDALEIDTEDLGFRQAVEDLLAVVKDPGVQEGIRYFATGIVGALEGAVTAASTLALAIREIGASISDVTGDLTPLEQLQERLRDLEGTNPIGHLLFSEESLREEIARLVGVVHDAGDELGDALRAGLEEAGFDIAGIVTAPLEAELREANARVIELAVELQNTLKAIREEGANLEFTPSEDSRASGQARLDALVTRSQELQDELQAAERRVQDIGEEIAYQRSQIEVRRVEEEAAVEQTAAKIVEVSTEAAGEAAEARVKAEEKANSRLESIAQRHWAQVAAIASGELEKIERERERTLAEIAVLEGQGGDPQLVAEARIAADRIYWEKREQLVQEKLDAEAAYQQAYWDDREERLQERLDREAAWREEVARRHRAAIDAIEDAEVRAGLTDEFDAAARAADKWAEETTAALDRTSPDFNSLAARIADVHAELTRLGAEDRWYLAMRDGLRELGVESRTVFDGMRTLVNTTLGGIEDAFVKFAQTGKLEFKTLADAVIADLARIAARETIEGVTEVILGPQDEGAAAAGATSSVIGAVGGLAVGAVADLVASAIGIDLSEVGDDIVDAIKGIFGDDGEPTQEGVDRLDEMIQEIIALPEIFRGVTADWEAIAERFGVSVQELAAKLEEAGGTPLELLGQLAAFGVDLGKFDVELESLRQLWETAGAHLQSAYDNFGENSRQFADALAAYGIEAEKFSEARVEFAFTTQQFINDLSNYQGEWASSIADFGKVVSSLRSGLSSFDPNLSVTVNVDWARWDDEDAFDTFHAGGVVGRRSGGARRRLSRSLFRGAPRYHQGGIAGLRPGEVPIIAREGEVIQTPEQAMQPPAVSVELRNLGTPQRQVAPATLTRRDRRWVIEVMTDDLTGGGDTARAIERQYGLAPALR